MQAEGMYPRLWPLSIAAFVLGAAGERLACRIRGHVPENCGDRIICGRCYQRVA